MNDLRDTLDVRIDVMIPEAQDEIPQLTKTSITNCVALSMFVAIVVSPIQFDNKARFTALEINDVTTDR